MNISNLSVDQARSILSNYVQFANEGLSEVDGDLDKANQVAVYNTETCSVTASTVDKIHKLRRSADLKLANSTAREVFKAAILTLFNVSDVSELDPHLQDALSALSEGKKNSPLSARRICCITQNVNLSLLSKGEKIIAPLVVSNAEGAAENPPEPSLHDKINTIFRNASDQNPQDVRQAVQAEVKAALSSELAAAGKFLRQVKDPAIEAFLASAERLASLDADTEATGKLKQDLDQLHRDLRQMIGEREHLPKFAVGTEKSAASYGLLQILARVSGELDRAERLASINDQFAKIVKDLPSSEDGVVNAFKQHLEHLYAPGTLVHLEVAVLVQRQKALSGEKLERIAEIVRNLDQLQGEMTSDAEKIYLANLNERCKLDKLLPLNKLGLTRLLQETSPDYIRGVRDFVEKEVTGAIEKEKASIRASYEEMGKSIGQSLLFKPDENFNDTFATERAKIESSFWASMANNDTLILDTKKIVDLYKTKQAEYAQAVINKQVRDVLTAAVRKEQASFAESCSKLKTSVDAPLLISEEKVVEFIDAKSSSIAKEIWDGTNQNGITLKSIEDNVKQEFVAVQKEFAKKIVHAKIESIVTTAVAAEQAQLAELYKQLGLPVDAADKTADESKAFVDTCIKNIENDVWKALDDGKEVSVDKDTIGVAFMARQEEKIKAILDERIESIVGDVITENNKAISSVGIQDGADCKFALPEKVITTFAEDQCKTIVASMWSALKGHVDQKFDKSTIGEAFKACRAKFVAEIEDAVGKQVRGAVESEKLRIRDEGVGDDGQLTLLGKEDEARFIAEQMKNYVSVAWEQRSGDLAVSLPTVKIEDAFAAAYSKGIKEKARTVIDELYVPFDEALKNVKKDLEKLTKSVAAASASYDAEKKALEKENAKINLEKSNVQNLILSARRKIDACSAEIEACRRQIVQIKSASGSKLSAAQQKKLASLESAESLAEVELAQNNEFLKTHESILKSFTSSIAANNDRLRELEDGVKTIASREERLQTLIEQETRRLSECRDALVSGLKLVEKPDVALLEKRLAKFKAALDESIQILKSFAESAVELPARTLVSPESFSIFARYGLHDTARFASRAILKSATYLVNVFGDALSQTRLPADRISQMKEAVAALLASRESIPEDILKLAAEVCRGESCESVAQLNIEERLELYMRTLADALGAGVVRLELTGPRPPITAEMMEQMAASIEAANPRGDESASISAFGNEALLEAAAKSLTECKLEDCEQLAADIVALARQFGKSENSDTYECRDFDELYLRNLTEQLDRTHAGDGQSQTNRRYMVKLLKGLTRAALDKTNSDNISEIVRSAKEFVRMAKAFVTEADAVAHATIVDALSPNVARLLGFGEMTTIDRQTLVDRFTGFLRITPEEFAAYTPETVDRLLNAIQFIALPPEDEQDDDDESEVEVEVEAKIEPEAAAKKQDDIFTSDLGVEYKAFFRSVAEDSFPSTLLTQNSRAILRDMVVAQRAIEAGDEDEWENLKITTVSRGFGTMDAKEILCGLSTDSLLNLPYRPVNGDDDEHPSTFEILSLLFTANNKKFGGLNEVCQMLFGTGIADVTRKQFALAKDKIARNKEFLSLYGIGVFKDCDAKDMPAIKAQYDTAKILLTTGVESLFATSGTEPKFNDLMAWIKACRAVGDGTAQTLTMNNQKLVLRQNPETGGLVATVVAKIGDKKKVREIAIPLWIPSTPRTLERSLIESALRHASSYKEKGMREQLAALLSDPTEPDARDLAMQVIKSVSTFDSVQLASVKTADLVGQARAILLGKIKVKDLTFDRFISIDRFNSEAVLDSLARLDAAEKMATDEGGTPPPVTIHRDEPIRAELTAVQAESARWRGFAADVLCIAETWKLDALAREGEKNGVKGLAVSLENHAAELAELAAMGAEEQKRALAALGDESLAAALTGLVAELGRIGGSLTAENVGGVIAKLSDEAVRAFQKAVQTSVKKRMEALQNEFTTEFVDKLNSTGLDDVDLMSLHDMAGTDSVNMSSGYGKFLKDFLGSYFKNMGLADQQAMLAAVLRESSVDASPVARLTALVKSAGPIFIKIMQSIPSGAVPVAFQTMISDVKDSMPPINDRVVKAQLLDLVVGSNNQVTGIDVVRSLGAASVGEAFLCRIRTPQNPDGEECVVKLLRPGVQNYAAREIAFIHTLPGKGEIFSGRIDSILKELDLRREAENVEASKIYDTLTRTEDDDDDGDDDVGIDMDRISTMQLHPILRPTGMSLVARKEPGMTCEKYFMRVGKEMDRILEEVTVVEEVAPNQECYRNAPAGGRKVYKVKSYEQYAAIEDSLYKLYQSALRRQQDLLSLAYKWADAALFPGTGKLSFIHGDLHDGNIMIGPEGMAFIDFGNAMTVNAAERKHLVNALFYCGKGAHEDFIDQLKAFNLKIPKNAGKAINAEIENALGKGTVNDTAVRFAAAIGILQKYNVVIPPVLFSFSQSMLRIQNAVERANEMLRKIQSTIKSLALDKDSINPEKDPFALKAIFNQATDAEAQQLNASAVSGELQDELGYLNKEELVKKRLESFCKDKDGKFNREKIEKELLPLVERRKHAYVIKPKSARVPEDDQKVGMRLYRRVLELAKSDIDLTGEGKQEGALKLANAIEMIAEDFMETLGCVQENYLTLDEFKENVSAPPQAFAEIFQRCISDHGEECKAQLGKAAKIWIGVTGRGDLKHIARVKEAEAHVIKKTNAINATFLGKPENGNFAIDAVGHVVDAVEMKFVYEDSVFKKRAFWGGDLAKQRERIFAIFRSNVTRLLKTLENKTYYDASKDHNRWGGKKAVELAMLHWGLRHKTFINLKQFTDDDIKAIKGMAEKSGMDRYTRELLFHAIDFVHQTQLSDLDKDYPLDYEEYGEDADKLGGGQGAPDEDDESIYMN